SAANVAGAATLLRALDPGASNDVIVGRLARTADPAGTTEETGNGRLNLAQALSDTSSTGVVPVGAPVGGPFIGPYVAAACNANSPTISRSVIQANGDPGTISQGNTYFVYAQVDVPGSCSITSVTANLVNLTAGATGVALSTASGPWTVAGLSYNYRASQTANSSLS